MTTTTGPIAELERVRAERDRLLGALRTIHRGLWPENYDRDEPTYEWDAGTIEWVAEDVTHALQGDSQTAFERPWEDR